jgi:peptide/nickel transport system substrate-binding protein
MVAMTSPISGIDPSFNQGDNDRIVMQNLYDELVQQGVEGGASHPDNIEPMLAKSWQISPDGRTYTFKLRDDVTFASGNPLTAADVVYSLNRHLNAKASAAYTMTGGLVGNFQSITALDNLTVQIQLKLADPLLLVDLARQVFIVDSKALESQGGTTDKGNAWISTHSGGSGPFVLESYQPDSQIVLRARDDYWGGTPLPTRVTIRIVQDPATLSTLADSGTFNLILQVANKDIDRIASSAGMNVLSHLSDQFVNIGLNVKKKPLDDVRVRQALNYATPVDQIIQAVGYGYVQPWVGVILDGMKFYKPLTNPYLYDLDKARALMKDAGLDHVKLAVTLVAGEPDHTAIATILQAEWAKIGVELTLNTLGPSAYYNALDGGTHDLYITRDRGHADPAFMLDYFVGCSPYNYTEYCNNEVQSWLVEAHTSNDPARRAELYQQVNQKAMAEALYIQLFQLKNVIVADQRLTGYIFYEDNYQRFAPMTIGQ